MEVDKCQEKELFTNSCGQNTSEDKTIHDGLSTRSLADINCILRFAKLEQSDVRPAVQSLYFSEELENDSIKLLELDQPVLEALEAGKQVKIRGEKNDSAVLVTDTLTYDLKEAETSNSLLLLPELAFGPELPSDGAQSMTERHVKSVVYNYFELRKIKPRLKKLRQLLEANPYRGRECEGDEDDTGKKYMMEDFLNMVQASEAEIHQGLKKLQALEINGVWRILDFEYLSTVVYHVLQLCEERDWLSEGVNVSECCQVLTELFPREIIVHIVKIFARGDVNESLEEPVHLDEDKVCKHFAELCLKNSGKFNLKEFLQAWQGSVPEGMKTDLAQIEGMALADRSTHPEVIWYYCVDDLPSAIAERFEVLFEERKKWTLEEISPYIRDLTTEKMDIGAMLTKFARASMQNGVKVFSSRKQV